MGSQNVLEVIEPVLVIRPDDGPIGPKHVSLNVLLTLNLLAPTTVGARINPYATNVIYIYIYVCVCVCVCVCMEHLFLMFLDHTQRRTTVGRTPLDE